MKATDSQNTSAGDIIRRQLAARLPIVLLAAAALVILCVTAVPKAAKTGGSYAVYSLLLIAAWLVLTVKWAVQFFLLLRRYRSGANLDKPKSERVFGIVMTALFVLLAAASFAVYMAAAKAGALPNQ